MAARRAVGGRLAGHAAVWACRHRQVAIGSNYCPGTVFPLDARGSARTARTRHKKTASSLARHHLGRVKLISLKSRGTRGPMKLISPNICP